MPVGGGNRQHGDEQRGDEQRGKEERGKERGRQANLRGLELDRHGRSEEAAQAFREAAELGDFNAPYNLGLLLERQGHTEEARRCYAVAHRAGHPEAANNLGVLLNNEGDPAALTWFLVAAANGHPQAAANVRLFRSARPGPAVEPVLQPMVLRAQAESAYRQFDDTGNDAALVLSVNLARRAVRSAPADHPARALLLAELRDILRFRYDLRGHSADLNESVTVALEALAALSPGQRGRMDAARAAVTLVRTRSEATGDAAALRSVVDAGRQVLGESGGGTEDRAGLEGSLCAALTSLSLFHTATDADLDEAVELGTAAVQRLPSAEGRTDLGGALCVRGTGRGSPDDLDRAVRELRTAVAEADSPRLRAQIATNLESALRSRAHLTGRSEDLREAGTVSEQARAYLETAPGHHPRTLIHSAYSAEGPAAVDAARRALAAVPVGHATRPLLLVHLAQALAETGERDEAVAAAREAAATAVSRQNRVDAGHTLGQLLLSGGEGDGPSDEALAQAVEALGAAVSACDESDLSYARLLARLAAALDVRAERTANASDREAACAALRAAARAVGSSPQDRLVAARAWAGTALGTGDTADALAGARVAVALLQEIGWTGLERADQEEGLRGGAAMPRDAAALAVTAKDPELAVELLEQGRSVLWRSSLHLRSDLASLAAREPSLAAELEQVRSALDGDRQLDTETRMRLARQWTRLLTRARKVPGFEDFLAPAAFGALAPAAAKGPVVIVNISTIRCDALLVLPGGRVEVVPLPRVTAPEADRVCNTYLNHLGQAAAPRASGLDRERARHTVHDTLEWLWDRIARPVLDRLGLPYDCAGRTPPRLWWCPTASLLPLPLHAAGRYPRTTGDRSKPVGMPYAAVSSYTTTLAALVDARRRTTVSDPRLLAVAVPVTGRGHPPLDGVGEEIRALGELFGDRRLKVLSGGEASVDAVRKHLPGHLWAHFACHGTLDMHSPTASGLCLADGDMNVLDFADLRLEHADLAVLSACHTRLGGGQLPDEAIHTAAALRMAGFRHVVASLWTVSDRAAPLVAASFYRRLGVSDAMDSAGAATALHRAVAELREGCLTDPTVWVPFVHDGP
ncbi:CHAT domain-containing protein [Streptomyces sp. NPDC003023]|uniref:CHAT domain-containing protein n=1 Tax=Streptomyces sp. NPDC003023 TaxID=3364675 RepID=UPI003679A685